MAVDCEFIAPEFVCPHCGWHGLAGLRKTCERRMGYAPPPPPPPLFKRLANFSKAAIAHAMNGMPTCTQEEIDARYAICKACDLFKPDTENPEVGVCSHSDCGCQVTREDKFVSKLAWREDGCPLKLWPILVQL